MGFNSNLKGFPLERLRKMFLDLFKEMKGDGYFDEYLGSWCVDAGDVPGKIRSPETDILLKTRKDHLWPIESHAEEYAEDDLFDAIEYLFGAVSKPIKGTYHSYSDCGMHWATFDKSEGEKYYCHRVNALLQLYEKKFEFSWNGEILLMPEQGLEAIFKAATPTKDVNISSRIESAVSKFRRYGSSFDDRRQAVRDLADVLEYLRPQVKRHLTKKDEGELFNIANNFGIRHHNASQKTDYDAPLWQSWMFYVFLSTIHLVLRKIESPAK